MGDPKNAGDMEIVGIVEDAKYQNAREPAYPIAVLAEAQRETLRSLCGPKPAAL